MSNISKDGKVKTISATKLGNDDSTQDVEGHNYSFGHNRYFFHDDVRLGLLHLASSFMKDGLNSLLGAVFTAFEKERLTTVTSDFLHFFSVIGFFIEFFRENSKTQTSEENQSALMSLSFMFNAEFVRFILKKMGEFAESKEYHNLQPVVYCYKELVKIYLLICISIDFFSFVFLFR
jgi:hypothetical protein